MKKAKSITALLLCAAMAFSFWSCQNPVTPDDSPASTTTQNGDGSNGGGGSSGGTNGGNGATGGTTTTLTMQETPLTLEAINAGTITLYNPPTTFKYKKNNGEFQTVTTAQTTIGTYTVNNATIDVSAGDKIAMYADGSSNNWGNSIFFTIRCSQACYAYGNVMSLQSSNNFANLTTITGNYAFCGLFADYYNLQEDPSITNKIRKHSVKNLVLPATTLTTGCYSYMFSSCKELTAAPSLPATTLTESCYQFMFDHCTTLTTAPSLPATTLATRCYASMFSYSGLTSAPALPATTLSTFCYFGMFEYTALTNAPDLNAPTLVTGCYNSMFNHCSNLRNVKCLATTITDNSTSLWLSGTASEGPRNFRKANGANWPESTDGIPEGWTTTTE